MISYRPGSHLYPPGDVNYTEGFVAVDTDDPARVAKCINTYSWSPSRFKDGYRKQENFLGANWLGLDFDSPEMSLEEMRRAVCDMVHVIGTTRNHQKAKGKPSVTCDRFRVLLRAERFMDAGEYKATLYHLSRKWEIDSSCIDEGRHFYACIEIISVNLDPEAYLQEVITPPPVSAVDIVQQNLRRARYEATKALPRWLSQFLQVGTLIRAGGRNNTIYAAAIELTNLGLPEPEIIQMIAGAPIDRTGLSDREFMRTIHSGCRRGM